MDLVAPGNSTSATGGPSVSMLSSVSSAAFFLLLSRIMDNVKDFVTMSLLLMMQSLHFCDVQMCNLYILCGCVLMNRVPVSYTHLTLPTKLSV